MSPTIITYTGIRFPFTDPESDDFRLEDIARSLSRTPRFGGMTIGNRGYSVAQHSFYVSCVVSEELAMAALLHDATEAYLRDIPAPVKRLLPDYQALEGRIEAALALSFGLPVTAFEHPEIRQYDLLLQALEAKVLLPNPAPVYEWCGGRPDRSIYDLDAKFHIWAPDYAEQMFLARHKVLTGRVV